MIIGNFGSKDMLFAQAAEIREMLPDLSGADHSKIGENIVRHYIGNWEGEFVTDGLPILLNSSISNEAASEKLKELVQVSSDRTVDSLNAQVLKEEAEITMDNTVHWLRHTGISEHVKIGAREHVRDDVGHSSNAITSQNFDIELTERHKSAKRKKIRSDCEHWIPSRCAESVGWPETETA